MAEISIDEKINIVESHIKNVEYNQYNNQLGILEEKAKASPSQANLSSLSANAADYVNQLASLNAELVTLQAQQTVVPPATN